MSGPLQTIHKIFIGSSLAFTGLLQNLKQTKCGSITRYEHIVMKIVQKLFSYSFSSFKETWIYMNNVSLVALPSTYIAFSHGHCRRRAVSFRLFLTQWMMKNDEGPLAVQSRSPGRESTQRLCTCSNSNSCVIFLRPPCKFLFYYDAIYGISK